MKTQKAKLGKVCEVLMGQSPPSSAYNSDGVGLPFFQGKADFGDLHPTVRVFCNKPTRVAYAGDVLMSVRAPVGPTNMAREICCIGRGLAALRVGSQIERTYLLYFLRHAEHRIAAIGTGSTFEAINRDDLEEIKLLLPSLPDQRRIAGTLEQADRLRRTRRYALDLSDTFLPAAFLEMFGDPVKNPKGWEKQNLGEIACSDRFAIVDGPFGSHLKAEEYTDSGVRVIRVNNIRPNEFNLDDVRFISMDKYETIKRSTVRPSDLVMAKVGNTIGKTCLFPSAINFAVLTANVCKITLDNERVSPLFICRQMNFDGLQNQIIALSGDTAKPMINIPKLKELTFIVPPLVLQQHFADLVRGHERLRAAQRESLRQAEHLFQSLLHRVFE